MDSIASALVGAICIVIGISNRKGNVSMLHSYHRSRVSEENKLPFGKLVGLGMIIVGVSLIVMGAMTFLASSLSQSIYATIGSVCLISGLVLGLGITFYAMIKYNKGIF